MEQIRLEKRPYARKRALVYESKMPRFCERVEGIPMIYGKMKCPHCRTMLVVGVKNKKVTYGECIVCGWSV